MLLYSRFTFWRIVFSYQGSVVFRWGSLGMGVLVALLTFMICWYLEQDSGDEWSFSPPNPLGWNMMGGTIVFAVVFRTSLGWSRYWEAVTQIQVMYSKWMDAYMQAEAFFSVTISTLTEKDPEGNKEKILLLQMLIKRIRGNFCLMSAMASHRLTHGDVQRMDKRAELSSVSWADQVALRKNLRIGPDLTEAFKLPDFVAAADISEVNNGENTWFGSYYVLSVPTEVELKLLDEANDRVNAVMYWIVHDLALAATHLSVAPPIQSRIYQELSTGDLAFSNALKISDVPFPFQFSQLFNLLVCSFTLFIPLYAAVFTTSVFVGPVVAFAVHQTLVVINKVAVELETPFGTEANDISLKDFHARFMEGIMETTDVSKKKSEEPILPMVTQPSQARFTTLDGLLKAKRAPPALGEVAPVLPPAKAPKVVNVDVPNKAKEPKAVSASGASSAAADTGKTSFSDDVDEADNSHQEKTVGANAALIGKSTTEEGNVVAEVDVCPPASPSSRSALPQPPKSGASLQSVDSCKALDANPGSPVAAPAGKSKEEKKKGNCKKIGKSQQAKGPEMSKVVPNPSPRA